MLAHWSGGTRPRHDGAVMSGGMEAIVRSRGRTTHDTPSKDLFLKDVRAFSHGCIRVGDALGFANTLLRDSLPRDRIDAIVSGGETQTIALPKPIPVYVTYFTADVGKDGRVAILPDIYKRDSGAGALPIRCAG